MEHNRITKYRTKLHSHQVMCLHSLSKSEVIEGKSTKIAQIRDQVSMHSHIQTKLVQILENPLN